MANKLIVTGPPLASKYISQLGDLGFNIVNGTPAILNELGATDGNDKRDLTEAEISQAIEDAVVYIYGGLEPASRAVLQAAKKLRLIAFLGTGWADPGCVDKTVTEQGIAVTNTPGANAASVAEVTIGLIIALQRQIVYLNNQTKSGTGVPVRLRDISGRRLGIVGLGAIGSRVATHARQGFNMEVVYAGPHPKPELEKKLNLRRVSLSDLLSTSDFVTLHSPARTSVDLIAAKELSLMSREAFLINCCSPEVVNGKAIVAAIQSSAIAGAAFDGVYKEPSTLRDAFLALPDDKLIVLPRTAWLTEDSYARMAEMAVSSIRDFMSGHDPICLVNPEYKTTP